MDIPILFSPIDQSEVVGRSMTPEVAYYEILLNKSEYWSAASNNRWYQFCLNTIALPDSDYSTVRYFSESLVILTNKDCQKASEEITKLVKLIEETPQFFIDELRKWYGELTPVEVVKAISEAQILTSFDDDSRLAFGNFFTFLASLKFALQKAIEDQKCFLYAVVDG